MDIVIGPVRADSAPGQPPGGAAYVANAYIRHDDDGIFYTPRPSLSVSSSATAANSAPRGFLTAVTKAGVYRNFVLTSDTIYIANYLGVLTSLGTGYNLPAGDFWSCCQFGTKAIFTNRNDGMLVYDVEAGGAVSALSGAPKARVVRAVFDVLFALDCDGNNRIVRNSDFDYTNWTSGVAGYQEFPDGLDLLGIEEISDTSAVLLQRSRVRILNRVPTTALWTQTTMARNEGAINPWCIVPAHGSVFFVDVNGFKRAGASGVQPIGAGKVDHYFWDQSLITDGSDSVLGAYHPSKDIVRWVYRTSGLSANYTAGIDYDCRADEFVMASETLTGIATIGSSGLTMEDLDAYGDMDSLTTSLDSRAWFGGSPAIAGYNGSYKFGLYTGANMAAQFNSNVMTMPQRGVLKRALVDSDSGSVSVVPSVSERLADTLTAGSAATPDASGYVEFREGGKNFSLDASIAAGTTWNFMRGYRELEIAGAGKR